MVGMKILVTGYKGFIGSNMVSALRADGHTVSLYEWGEQLPTDWDLDWVIHLGAESSTTFDDVPTLLEKNYYFTLKLLTLCNTHKVNVQFASSASVYGFSKTFREYDIPSPRNYYAWSKFMVEEYVRTRPWDIHVQMLRYFNVYGPGEDHKGNQASPFHKFKQQALTTRTIELFEGSDTFARDFIHVDDVIKYHKKFFKVDQGGIFNIGTGVTKTFESVANEVALTYNASIRTIPMPDNLKASYQTYTKADMFKTRTVLSYY